jgi:CheY-like chemotaxis protein
MIAQRVQIRKRALLEQVGSLLQGTRVLVVDDNAAAREILAEMLQFFRMEVRVASSGAEALAILKQASLDPPFDLVLMDWSMPGMNGSETIHCIRADTSLPQPKKFVMATAYGREAVIKLVEQVGVDHILAKPVSPSALLDAVIVVPRARKPAHAMTLAARASCWWKITSSTANSAANCWPA